jgi:hypothetical protein
LPASLSSDRVACWLGLIGGLVLKWDRFVRLIFPAFRAEFPQQIRAREEGFEPSVPACKAARSLSEGEWLKGRMGSLEKCDPIGTKGSYPFASANVSWCESLSLNRLRPKRTAPGWGRTGRLLVRSARGKLDAVGEKGTVSERTVVLSASEATIAGREPSKVGSETTQIHRREICLGRDAPLPWRLGPLTLTAEEPVGC